MKTNQPISAIRKDYTAYELNEAEACNSPINQFSHWFVQARKIIPDEVNAMTLATVNDELQPEARIVLLKSFGEEGFTFYTNYQSQKGRDIISNANVSLLFYWRELERQVRIKGICEMLSQKDSEKYFYSRPIDSQIAAICSSQSEWIENRNELEKKFEEIKNLTPSEIIKPEHWGGYIVKPFEIEFWQGRANRLHDRLKYFRENKNQWRIVRLQP